MTLFQSWGFLGSDFLGVSGGTPIFSYIFRFRAFFFLVQSFRKSNTFGSMKIYGYCFLFLFFFFWGGGALRNRTFFFGGGGNFYTF